VRSSFGDLVSPPLATQEAENFANTQKKKKKVKFIPKERNHDS
jgi:hypothetical protein